MSEKKQGRPTKFKPEYEDQIKRLSLLGLTSKQIAEFFEVNVDTLYEWSNTYPGFSDAWKKGKLHADGRVAESLYHRALGYKHPAVDIKAVDGVIVETPYTKHHPPDTAAAIYWLKTRQPDQWQTYNDRTGETEPRSFNIQLVVEDARVNHETEQDPDAEE